MLREVVEAVVEPNPQFEQVENFLPDRQSCMHADLLLGFKKGASGTSPRFAT